MGDNSETKLKLPDLGISIHDVLRYTYAGVLALFAAYLLAPEATEKLIKDLNVVVVVAFGLAGGAAIHAFTRGILVWWMDPLVEVLGRFGYWCYRRLAKSCCKKRLPTAVTRRQYLEQEFGIPFFWSCDAFRVVRDAEFFSKEKREAFYRHHSEINTLYTTSVVLLAASFIHLWIDPADVTQSVKNARCLFIVFGVLAIMAGMFLDFLVYRHEGAYLRTLSWDKIDRLLSGLKSERIGAHPEKDDATGSAR